MKYGLSDVCCNLMDFGAGLQELNLGLSPFVYWSIISKSKKVFLEKGIFWWNLSGGILGKV